MYEIMTYIYTFIYMYVITHGHAFDMYAYTCTTIN